MRAKFDIFSFAGIVIAPGAYFTESKGYDRGGGVAPPISFLRQTGQSTFLVSSMG